MRSADQFSEALTNVAKHASGPITLDLARVAFMDSAGLRVLIAATLSASSHSPIRIAAMSASVKRLLEMTDLLAMLTTPGPPSGEH